MENKSTQESQPSTERFTMVPDEIAQSKFLNCSDKLFISLILRYQNDGKKFYVSNAFIRKKLGIGQTSLNNMMKRIEDLGFGKRVFHTDTNQYGQSITERTIKIFKDKLDKFLQDEQAQIEAELAAKKPKKKQPVTTPETQVHTEVMAFQLKLDAKEEPVITPEPQPSVDAFGDMDWENVPVVKKGDVQIKMGVKGNGQLVEQTEPVDEADAYLNAVIADFETNGREKYVTKSTKYPTILDAMSWQLDKDLYDQIITWEQYREYRLKGEAKANAYWGA